MDVALSQDQIVLASYFYLERFVSKEKYLIIDFDTPDEWTDGYYGSPAQTTRNLGGGGDEDARSRLPLAFRAGNGDQHAIRKHGYGVIGGLILVRGIQWHESKVPFISVLREPLSFASLDGTMLEGELVTLDSPWAGAVLTHPHPRHGGNMRSMVPGELTRILPQAGIAVLRFNFRGMGASEGAFENGVGERLDVEAAIDLLHGVVEGLPLVVCGSSFGADTALTVPDSRLDAWVACAPPLRDEKFGEMQSVGVDNRPKLLVVAERDQYRDPNGVNELTASWVNTDVVVIKGADHFFVGNLEKVGQVVLHYLLKFRPTD